MRPHWPLGVCGLCLCVWLWQPLESYNSVISAESIHHAHYHMIWLWLAFLLIWKFNITNTEPRRGSPLDCLLHSHTNAPTQTGKGKIKGNSWLLLKGLFRGLQTAMQTWLQCKFVVVLKFFLQTCILNLK